MTPATASPSLVERLNKWADYFGPQVGQFDVELALLITAAKEAAEALTAAPAPGDAEPVIPISILLEHWLTGVHCDGETETDTATCFCSVWRSAPMPTQFDAVKAWIAHVQERAAHAPPTPPGKEGQP